MLATQRQLTALAVLAVALVLTACGAADRAGSAVVADTVPPDGGVAAGATTSPLVSTSTSTSTSSTDAGSVAAGADPAALSGQDAGQDAGQESGESSGDALEAAHHALDQGDICGVYAGLAEVDLSTTSDAQMSAQMRRIRDIMVGTVAIAPSSVRADWQTLTDGTADMLESLNGDQASAAEHFDDDSYRVAAQRVEGWIGEHCG